jgi:hypothetical protein
MLSHLQKLAKHGFMTAVELKACLEVEDPALPMPVEGYDVLYCVLQAGIRHATARFLRSLLRYYGLEFH